MVDFNGGNGKTKEETLRSEGGTSESKLRSPSPSLPQVHEMGRAGSQLAFNLIVFRMACLRDIAL